MQNVIKEVLLEKHTRVFRRGEDSELRLSPEVFPPGMRLILTGPVFMKYKGKIETAFSVDIVPIRFVLECEVRPSKAKSPSTK